MSTPQETLDAILNELRIISLKLDREYARRNWEFWDAHQEADPHNACFDEWAEKRERACEKIRELEGGE